MLYTFSMLSLRRLVLQVTIGSENGGNVDAASAEVHTLTDDATSFASARFTGFGQVTNQHPVVQTQGTL